MSDSTYAESLEIPDDYAEIYDFACQNRIKLGSDWNLLFEVIRKINKLLNDTKNPFELHKNTRIMLESIKIMHDNLLKEFRKEINFEKMLFMAENEELDDFFTIVKANSQSISFIDHLVFETNQNSKKPRAARATDLENSTEQIKPEILDHNVENKDSNASVYELHDKVTAMGRIEYFRLVVDLESYSKTIINAFNLALALRQNLVSIKMIDSILYIIPYVSEQSELCHSALEITPFQYELLKEVVEKENNRNNGDWKL